MKKKNAIEDYIDRAIDDEDFREVANAIEKSVESAIQYTKVGAGALMRGVRRGFSQEPERLSVNRNPAFVHQKITAPNTWFWLRNVAALGSAGAVLMLFLFLFSGIGGLAFSHLIMSLLFAAAAAVGALVTVYSHRQMEFSRDFFRIRREIADNLVLSTEDICTALNRPKRYVLDRLSEMIRRDYLPQARIVEDGELLLLDQSAYEAYKDNYRKRSVTVHESPRSLEEETREQDDRAVAIRGYKETLADQLKRAKTEEIKGRIRSLLPLLESIEHAISGNPDRIEDLNKFADYYTPTTIKLVEHYIQFESSAVATDAIRRAMQDILRSLDTVIDAYKKLLDSLYSDDLLEMQAEMNVMETVLRQDGLLEKDEIRRNETE